MWKKYQTTLASDVCAITAAKSRLEHDPDPKWRPSRNLGRGLRGLAQAFRLGVRPDMNWSFK
jgi:hypothetical protein